MNHKHGDGRGRHACTGHFVQFYRNEKFIATSLSEYVRMGLENKEGVVILATQEHQQLLRDELEFTMPNFQDYILNRQILFYCVEEVLTAITTEKRLDFIKFQDLIGGIIEHMAANFGSMRFYGEVVNLLCERNRTQCALELESYWNTILKSKENIPIMLMCGYATKNLKNDYNACDFTPVCEAHSDIIPAEYLVEEETDQALYRKMAILEMRSALLSVHSKDKERLIHEMDEMREALAKNWRWE